MSSKHNKHIYSYLKSIVEKKRRFYNFLMVHELYVPTPELFKMLFALRRKKHSACASYYPFSYSLSFSTHHFRLSEHKKLHARIKRRNSEDAELFRQEWIQKGRDYPTNNVRSHSQSTTIRQSLPLVLRGSMKNVLELWKDRRLLSLQQKSRSSPCLSQRERVLSWENIRKYAVSTALTYIDLDMMRKRTILDLTTPTTSKAPIIQQQEKLLEWVVSSITAALHPSDTIQRWLKVCKHLKKQRNYQSLFTILRALLQIKDTKGMWDGVSKRECTFFQNIVSIFDPAGSFRNYRWYVPTEREERAEPRIPCFPIFSRDLYLISQHNALWLDDHTINELFIHKLAECHHLLLSVQRLTFHGKVDLKLVEALTFV